MEKEKVLEIEFMQVWDKWAWTFKKNNTKEIVYSSSDKTNSLTIVNGVLFSVINDNKTNINEFNLLNDYSKTKLEEFVNEINEKYGIPKRWRANFREMYYYIDFNGEIKYEPECNYKIDNYRYNLGNYFRTKEEVENIAESKEYREYQEFLTRELREFWTKVRAGEIGEEE